MTEYDARIQDQQQLAAIYGSWAELTKTKRLTVLHGILLALAIIVAIYAGGAARHRSDPA